MHKSPINWADFEKIDIRIGTIERAQPFEKAKTPAYQLWVNFGELGIKKTSAQITSRYKIEDLIGKQIVAVVNSPPKQIANFMSECLILGAVDGKDVIILSPDAKAKNGAAIA